VVLLFSQAPAGGDGGGLPSLHQLARPNGLIVGVTRATLLLGVVAFGIAAAQTASEYSLGTLRQLLVRQPRRIVLLVGKMLGAVTFLLLALCFAAVVAFAAAVVAAHARGGLTVHAAAEPAVTRPRGRNTSCYDRGYAEYPLHHLHGVGRPGRDQDAC
jgi:hypothetical protein